MVGIVPHQYQRSIFEIIVRDSIDLVVSDGEAIVSKAKKAIATSDFLSVMSVFCVIRHLAAVKPRVDRTLEGCEPAVRSKYNAMTSNFYAAGSLALERFVEGIRYVHTGPQGDSFAPRPGLISSPVLRWLI